MVHCRQPFSNQLLFPPLWRLCCGFVYLFSPPHLDVTIATLWRLIASLAAGPITASDKVLALAAASSLRRFI
ncbi:hypothetical protein PILCRDRAFT_822515 [Piloderma croceum F 1598]|uniref:Uncharacterized protein n=1 Tax=Piloderma croceum (strain F 1598) TaxID=765440 RepID=A0A0C3B2D8_PILCF|nr:hypothetical protein PILCRDRAFT_822515 [Piloderma croceum F 1598]